MERTSITPTTPSTVSSSSLTGEDMLVSAVMMPSDARHRKGLQDITILPCRLLPTPLRHADRSVWSHEQELQDMMERSFDTDPPTASPAPCSEVLFIAVLVTFGARLSALLLCAFCCT
jgi:hypothetical protein